ncbi:MAG: hypothetical protein K9G48_15555 [Reyranella sp.]|nr:hypothetical protein [Reyranella sp.]
MQMLGIKHDLEGRPILGWRLRIVPMPKGRFLKGAVGHGCRCRRSRGRRRPDRTASPAVGSGLEQNWQCLPVSDFRAGLEFRQGATADGMLDREEGVVGQAQDTGDVSGRYLERLGAQHHRPLAELFEADAIVQTAR